MNGRGQSASPLGPFRRSCRGSKMRAYVHPESCRAPQIDVQATLRSSMPNAPRKIFVEFPPAKCTESTASKWKRVRKNSNCTPLEYRLRADAASRVGRQILLGIMIRHLTLTAFQPVTQLGVCVRRTVS